MKTMILFLAAVAIVTVGCSENPYHAKGKDEIKSGLAAQVAEIQDDDTINDKEKSRRLTRIGKVLLETPKGADAALEILDMALAKDSQNLEANLYSAALLPVHALKGIAFRSTKLATGPVVAEIVDDILEDLHNSDVQNLVSDLLQSSELGQVFKTPSELQDYLSNNVMPAIKEAQKRVAVVENENTFHSTFNFRHWQDGFHFITTVTFDQAEVRSLKIVLTAMEAAIKVATAYDIEAAVTLRDKFMGQKVITMKDVVEEIKKHATALTLKAGGAEGLKSILASASDAMEGLKLIARLLNNQDKREGMLLHPFRSQGHFSEFMAGLNYAADILVGPTNVVIGREKETYKRVYVLANAPVVFSAPIEDLKTLLPTAFNKDGQKATEFGDLSFGGIIPNSDLIEKACQMDKEHQNIECP